MMRGCVSVCRCGCVCNFFLINFSCQHHQLSISNKPNELPIGLYILVNTCQLTSLNLVTLSVFFTRTSCSRLSRPCCVRWLTSWSSLHHCARRSLPGEFHNNGNLDTDGIDFLLSCWLSELLKEYFILIHVVSVLYLWPQETYKQIHHVLRDWLWDKIIHVSPSGSFAQAVQANSFLFRMSYIKEYFERTINRQMNLLPNPLICNFTTLAKIHFWRNTNVPG